MVTKTKIENYSSYSPEIAKETSNIESSRRLLEGLTLDPSFIEYSNGADTGTFEYYDSLSKFIEDYTNAHADILDTEQIEGLLVLANAPLALDVSERISEVSLRRDKNEYIEEPEWSAYNDNKRYSVWYNKLLGNYMENNPDSSFSEIKQAISDSAASAGLYSEVAEKYTRYITTGARTEVASKDLLQYVVKDFGEVTEGTEEDDLRGGDLWIKVSGKRLKIDIKNSMSEIEAGRDYDPSAEKLYRIGKYVHKDGSTEKSIILFPGFTSKDLGDSILLDDAQKEKLAPRLGLQLYTAIHEATE